jgi:hypothetical protein
MYVSNHSTLTVLLNQLGSVVNVLSKRLHTTEDNVWIRQVKPPPENDTFVSKHALDRQVSLSAY